MSTATRKRKAQRALEKKRRQQMTVLGLVAVVAVVGVALLMIANVPPPAPVSSNSIYQDLPHSLDENGMPQLGSPDAPVVVMEHSSFGCGHCANFHDDQFMQLLEDVREGTVRLVFAPVSNSFSIGASAAAFCAEEQGMFWEMHDTLFSWLRQYSNGAFTQSRITAGAREMGLDTDAFNACLTSAETQSRIDVANDLFFSLAEEYEEVTGTPTITFNGVPPEFGSGGPPMDYINQRIAELSGS